MKPVSLGTFVRVVASTVILTVAVPAFAQKAIIVVRHAEKVDESADPLLSTAGTARAEALGKALKSMNIKAAYVTQFQRTALTAAPLATALGLKAIQVHSDASPELVERMRKEHPNDVVLAVGHSNSVPKILKLLGHMELVEIGHDEYDSLFVVVPAASGPPTVLRLRY